MDEKVISHLRHFSPFNYQFTYIVLLAMYTDSFTRLINRIKSTRKSQTSGSPNTSLKWFILTIEYEKIYILQERLIRK